MNTIEPSAVYQLVETPAAERTVRKETETVYSALALYPNGELNDSCFVYDISRERKEAEMIMDRLRFSKPDEKEIFDFISELL